MIRKTLIVSLISLSAFAVSTGETLIKNGSFTKPLAPWKVISLKGAPATDKSAEDGVLTITAAAASEKPGNRQLSQEVAVEAGKTYTLSFEVKGSIKGESEMVVAIVPAPGKFAFFKKVPVTAEWESRKMKVIPKEMAAGGKPSLKFLLGKQKGEICFRNVSLEPVADAK